MNFDYCEMDLKQEEGIVQINVGCRFADEPNELYVIVMDARQDGIVGALQLMFNGMDCKYTFKEEEKEFVLKYIQKAVVATEYASWFKNRLTLNEK